MGDFLYVPPLLSPKQLYLSIMTFCKSFLFQKFLTVILTWCNLNKNMANGTWNLLWYHSKSTFAPLFNKYLLNTYFLSGIQLHHDLFSKKLNAREIILYSLHMYVFIFVLVYMGGKDEFQTPCNLWSVWMKYMFT